jgi:RNA polymerase sigma factor (sigma-70 family)
MTDSGLKNQFLKQVEEHSDILHKIGNVYSTSREDKEDLIQEMVYQLWRSFKNFRKESKFSTWMYRVCFEHCFDGKKEMPYKFDENEILIRFKVYLF